LSEIVRYIQVSIKCNSKKRVKEKEKVMRPVISSNSKSSNRFIHSRTVRQVFLMFSFMLLLLVTFYHSGSSAFAASADEAIAQPEALHTMSLTDQIIALTNEQRAAHGCPALVPDPQLAHAAQLHSEDMAVRNYFSHTNPEGLSFTDRMTNSGYLWSNGAENIAAGLSAPQAVLAMWMNSPAHRAIILDCELREVGVGYALQLDDQPDVRLADGSIGGPFLHYWTQVLGVPAAQ
jgi:uncharacterized protein YkwD